MQTMMAVLACLVAFAVEALPLAGRCRLLPAGALPAIEPAPLREAAPAVDRQLFECTTCARRGAEVLVVKAREELAEEIRGDIGQA